jgi:hypothetical protein
LLIIFSFCTRCIIYVQKIDFFVHYAPPDVVAVAAGADGVTICNIPLNLSLNTPITPDAVPTSATVAAVPPKSVNALVEPLSVRVIGNVAVVPAGIAAASLTKNRPTGGSSRQPRAMSTAASDTVTLVLAR